MRALLLALCLLIFGCSVPPAPDAPLDYNSDPKANALESTIALLSHDDPDFVICAGQYIKQDVIVTAHHCIDSAAGTAEDVDPTGQAVSYYTHRDWESPFKVRRSGLVWALDKDRDVALILAAEPYTYWVPLGEQPVMGQVVFSIGHPNQMHYTVAAGLVTIPKIEGYVQAMIAIGPGSSGGGLYDEDWRLIGVASMMNNGGSMGYFVALDAVTDLLGKL